MDILRSHVARNLEGDYQGLLNEACLMFRTQAGCGLLIFCRRSGKHMWPTGCYILLILLGEHARQHVMPRALLPHAVFWSKKWAALKGFGAFFPPAFTRGYTLTDEPFAPFPIGKRFSSDFCRLPPARLSLAPVLSVHVLRLPWGRTPLHFK